MFSTCFSQNEQSFMAQRKKVERNTNCQLSHLGVRVQQHASRIIDAQIFLIWHRLQPETRKLKKIKLLYWLRVEIFASKIKHSCHFKWLLKLQITLQTLFFYYSSSLFFSAAVMTPLFWLVTHFFHGASFSAEQRCCSIELLSVEKKRLLRSCGAKPADVEGCRPCCPWCWIKHNHKHP